MRGTLPWVSLVLSWSPPVVLVGTGIAVPFHAFDGRYVMGGVVLGAATWGVVRVSPAASAAIHFAERPAGIGLLEPAEHPSVWTLPRAWSQSIQPEVSRMIEYLDAHARPGATIAVTRDKVVYPFAYAGWPLIEHRLVYADTLDEASRQAASWAVLQSDAACARAWRLALRSEQWAVYRHVAEARCR